mgnify:CR=1 FL=1|jgi:hypothetical protein
MVAIPQEIASLHGFFDLLISTSNSTTPCDRAQDALGLAYTHQQSATEKRLGHHVRRGGQFSTEGFGLLQYKTNLGQGAGSKALGIKDLQRQRMALANSADAKTRSIIRIRATLWAHMRNPDDRLKSVSISFMVSDSSFDTHLAHIAGSPVPNHMLFQRIFPRNGSPRGTGVPAADV